jgi:hypothetical protein
VTKCEDGKERIVLEGIVTPFEWRGEEHIKSFAVLGASEEEVIVENSGMGVRLAKLLRKRVRIEGRATGLHMGRQVVSLERITHLTAND